MIKYIFTFLKKIYLKSIFIINSKKIYKAPAHKKILIYDRLGSELFLDYFCPEYIEILDVRGESINIILLLKSLFNKISNRNYKLYYIGFVKPAVVITFIDNNIDFYKIKNIYPNIITIFVQNGYRGIIGDVFEKIQLKSFKYRVDYMLCFGDAIAAEYSKYIQGNIFSIGSFKNNLIKINPNKYQQKTILYISQFREENKHSSIFISSLDVQISRDQFYFPETVLLPLLHKFCKEYGYRLQICGCMSDKADNEIEYYYNLLDDYEWDYFSKKNTFYSYTLVDKAEFIVTIDSTLGYEALARLKKVAFFSCRGNYLNIDGADFGWPLIIDKKGEFWTDELTENEFLRVIRFLTNTSTSDWEYIYKQFIPSIINYDFENKEFRKLITNLKSSLHNQ